MNVKFLSESLMPVSSLRDYVESNYPASDGWTAKSPTDKNWPLARAENGKDRSISFFYPDGSPGQWFVLGLMLFISGRVFHGGHFEAAVFMYWTDSKNKTVSLHAIYQGDFGFIQGYPNAEKKMTNVLKRIMAKISTMRHWTDAEDILDEKMH